jgi:hypothetical protein
MKPGNRQARCQFLQFTLADERCLYVKARPLGTAKRFLFYHKYRGE